ncbi:MAG: hypothetical protein KDJ90_10240 [Nitratireductor sp.]|nr:hypothetical protein [Nitratireductor sp.]
MTPVAGMCEYLADRRGNFAVIFAVCLVPVMALAGAAVDYSRIRSAQGTLQDAADAGALAAAAGGKTDAQRQQTAEDFVHANAPGLAASVKTIVDTHDLTVEVTALLPLPVLSAFGKPETLIRVTSQVESVVPFSGRNVIVDGDEFERRADELRRRVARTTRQMPHRERERIRGKVEKAIESARKQQAPVRLSR